MSGRKQGRLRLLILSLVLLGLVVWIFPEPGEVEWPFRGKEPEPVRVETRAPVKRGEQVAVTLYTVEKGENGLEKTEAMIEASDDPETMVKNAVETLLSWEAAPAIWFEGDINVREVFVYGNVAVISLGGDFNTRRTLGVWTELLTVYSVVNTVTQSFDGIDRVQILVNDREAELFMGHVSIASLIAPDLSLVAEGAQPETETGEPAAQESAGTQPS